jgi:hypothetical protein
MVAEAARLSIQNGTSAASLGTQTQNYLEGLGATVAESTNTSTAYSQTVLIDHTGNPYTLAFLAEWMNVNSARIVHEFDPNSSIDVEVILGSDWQSGNPFP